MRRLEEFFKNLIKLLMKNFDHPSKDQYSTAVRNTKGIV